MSWKPEVEGIERRRELAAEHGGREAVEKQHARGRLAVRERIEALLDPGSFREEGGIAGQSELDAEGRLLSFRPANVVVGVGRIEGRPVVVCGDDFTVAGASYSQLGLQKAAWADQLAARRRIPLVRLLEAGGARITGTSSARGRSGYNLTSDPRSNLPLVEALATVPVVSAALGPVAGFPAAKLVASHLSLMTRETAQVLVGGPALVERALRQKVSKEELGGAEVQLRNGVVDNAAADEGDAFRQIRAFLGYLPGSVFEPAPRAPTGDPPGREEEALLEIVPRNRRRAYKMRRLVELVVDRGSFFEMGALHGRTQITGLARLDGHPVGILANDPMIYGGAMTADGARKVRRFVDLCDAFHLPVVSFMDEPGFAIGVEAERAGTIRHGVEALFAVLQSEVPWFALVVRKSFGVAAGIHLGPGCTAVAWPSAEFGAMPVEGGVAIGFRREIEAAPDPEARRRELEDEIAAAQSVFPRAEEFGVHDLIDPRKTRPLLCTWLSEVQPQLRGLAAPRRSTLRP
jgi:acetyl-CoA carboxylase carboxyltransferase component